MAAATACCIRLAGALAVGAASVVCAWAQVQPAAGGAPTAATRPAPAGQPEQGPRWSSLTPSQQAALRPLQQDWASIDAGRKQKWLEVAQRLPGMSAADQERVRERMAEWARMSPAERGRARVQFQEARQWSPQERQSKWEAYQALPSDEKRALAEKAQAPSPARVAAAKPAAGPQSKQNVVPATAATAMRPVAPMVVQAGPGATTTLVSRPVKPPLHHQAGLPKIVASRDFVDPATLLPVRGPQAAAVLAAQPASAVAASIAAGTAAQAASASGAGSEVEGQ